MIKFDSLCYILLYPDGRFVGIDTDFGGYPYPTKLPGKCHFWFAYKNVVKYQQMFSKENFSLHRIEGFADIPG